MTIVRISPAIIRNVLLLVFIMLLWGCDSPTDPDPLPVVGPVVTSFSPTRATVGSLVTISGSRFDTTAARNTVSIADIAADVIAATDTQITIAVPPGARTGPISVTVGAATGVSSSDFTLLWTPVQYNPTTPVINDICWTGTLFIAVGNLQTIYTSPDGLIWTARSETSAFDLNALAVGNDNILAVGDDGLVLSSDDGITWETAQDAIVGSDNLIGVASSGSLFVANADSDNYVLTSTTGTSWEKSVIAEGTSISHIAYTDQFVAFTPRDSVLVSDDAVTWSVLTTNLIAPPVLNSASRGRSVVIVKPNSLLYSTTTANWADVSPSRSVMKNYSDAAWAYRYFLAVGDAVVFSIDGSSFAVHSEFSTAPSSFPCVACSPDICVAIGGFGTTLMVWFQPE